MISKQNAGLAPNGNIIYLCAPGIKPVPYYPNRSRRALTRLINRARKKAYLIRQVSARFTGRALIGDRFLACQSLRRQDSVFEYRNRKDNLRGIIKDIRKLNQASK